MKEYPEKPLDNLTPAQHKSNSSGDNHWGNRTKSKSLSTSWWLSCAAINNIIKMHQHPAGYTKGIGEEVLQLLRGYNLFTTKSKGRRAGKAENVGHRTIVRVKTKRWTRLEKRHPAYSTDPKYFKNVRKYHGNWKLLFYIYH